MVTAGGDDSAWAPKPAAPAGVDLLPGYRDFVVIARGGDSIVYRAHQDALDRDVAVKVVLLDDAESIARFRRELAITVRLGRQHPNIMTVLATGTTSEGQPCLVMDYVELGSLHTRLTERGPLPVSEVVTAGAVVADALAFAHGQGVLHRDVKPQNVLVLPTSYVLADFGLARAIDAGHSSSLERFSYRHASPQILDGAAPAVADDVYSLGSTLFTLLDGRPPFAADDPDEDSALSYLRRARTEPPRPLRREDVPDRLRGIVARCLARERADRFADAAELRDALNAIPTETRSWAPDPAATPALPPAAAVVADPPPAPPPAADRPAPPPAAPEPEAVAVSALAQLPATPPPDPDATGLRRREPEPPPAPTPERGSPARRRVVIGGIGVVALAVGLVLGLRGGDGSPEARQSGPVRSSSSALVAPVPTVSVPVPTGAASAILDPAVRPRITTLKRDGTGLTLAWSDPSRGRDPFIVYLADGPLRPLLNPKAGVTSVTIADFPAGRHCLRVSTLRVDSGGQLRYGLGPPRCLG